MWDALICFFKGHEEASIEECRGTGFMRGIWRTFRVYHCNRCGEHLREVMIE